MTAAISPAARVAEIMTRIYELGHTTPSGGNISLKDADGNVWVTPSQVDKGRLRAEDIVLIRSDGSVSGQHPPTSEYPFHLGIYRSRPDIGGIVHAHPVSLVAFSITSTLPGKSLRGELAVLAGNTGFTSYAIPGSEELGSLVAEGFAKGYDAIVMENHGIISAGKSLEEAFYSFEALERMAGIELQTMRIRDMESYEPQAVNGSEAMPDTSPLSNADERTIREELASYARRACRRGLSLSMAGSWSARTGGGRAFYFPAGTDLAKAEAEEARELLDSKGSKGWGYCEEVFGSIYQRHPGIGAVVIAHPSCLMAFAAAGRVFDSRTIPESYIFLQNLALADQEWDSERLAMAVRPDAPCLIHAGNAFISTGASLFQAFDRMEVAEFTAASVIHSQMLGGLRPLDAESIRAINRKYLGYKD